MSRAEVMAAVRREEGLGEVIEGLGEVTEAAGIAG
jgi:hypothetical protein